MTEPTPAQIAKLPKWVLEYITKLQHQRQMVLKAYAGALDAKTPSRIYYWSRYFGADKKAVYIQSERLIFKVEDNELEVSFPDFTEGIRIRLLNGTMNILPEVSNSIIITEAKR